MYRYLCGVPHSECQGSMTPVNAFLATDGKRHKTHASRKEAKRCKVRSLLRKGYIQRGPSEFKDPKDGYILVLSKETHFGIRLRTGKEGARNQPDKGSGVII